MLGSLGGAGAIALADTAGNAISLTVGGNNQSTTFTGPFLGGYSNSNMPACS